MGDLSHAPSPLVAIPDGTEFADGDEPPSSPPHRPHRPRHPAWADVPDRDWDDWRWQSQNAVRYRPATRRPAPLHPRGAGAPSARLAGRVQARHPALLLLADRPRRPRRPDPAPVGPLAAGAGRRRRRRAGRPARRGQGLARPRPDPPLPRPRPARHDARLHHVLPLLHAQARDDEARRLGRRLAATTSAWSSTSATTPRSAT